MGKDKKNAKKETAPDTSLIRLNQIMDKIRKTDISDCQNMKILMQEVHIILTDIVKSHSKDGKFTIYVNDNFHYMDEDERYTLGVYDTEEEALQAAKRIVDEFLIRSYEPGISAAQLYDSYITFGKDPWIDPSPFNAWHYAKERCNELCEGKSTN